MVGSDDHNKTGGCAGNVFSIVAQDLIPQLRSKCTQDTELG